MLQAFMWFMQPDNFKQAVDKATVSSWSGNEYFVELFESGDYRLIPGMSLGNLYDTPGMILKVPHLTDEEWDDDESIRYYDAAHDYLVNSFQEKWAERIINDSTLCHR